jgi:preprotein translocase subunit SecE
LDGGKDMSETVSTETTPDVTTTAAEKKADNNSSKDSNKKSKFAGIKAEFKKIVWPDRMTVVKNTTAVVLVSIFVGIAVKVSDLLIQAVLDLLI